MHDQVISISLLKVVDNLFNSLSQQYPHLFTDLNKLNTEVELQLIPSQQNLTFINYLDVQKKIFKNLEQKKSNNWLEIYNSVYISEIRQSIFAKNLFSTYLEQALTLIGKSKFEHILIPGCGKFFEGDILNNQLSAKKISAVDVMYRDIEYSKLLNKNAPNIDCSYQDLTELNNYQNNHDLMLFLHPQLCDYNKMWLTPSFVLAENEIDISSSDILTAATVQNMPTSWQTILDNSFEKLNVNGHALFYFYEHRDLSIVLSYLENKSHLEVKMQHVNNYIVDPAFSFKYIKAIIEDKQQVANFVAMGAYRAVLLLKKTG
ncbi:MAG: hypothetical protein HRU38_02730 [Saccharospirillaceae bacterium]|nr:hypothetical protein [Pseudomonadales bacterium]NRB77577.1 hypothetical protein [Saccharospirillaceae bacterium]